MARAKVVVWDNIGNTLLGVRPWSSWAPEIQQWMEQERPGAPALARDLPTLLGEHEIDLEWWLADIDEGPLFRELMDDFPAAPRKLERIDQLVDTIRDADVVIIHKERLPAEAIAGAGRLKLLQHLGEDDRGLPRAAAQARGIPTASTPLANYIAVAEHDWAFILNWAKRFPQLRELMASGASGPGWNTVPGIRMVRDMTLGLVGFGEIARPIARVARAFGMSVVYWDIERFPELEERYGVRYVGWEDVFRMPDVVSIQLALNPQTEGIVGAREIGWMRPDALFMNSARGKLVDEPALVAALRDRRIGGAALDVFAHEPLPADDPLRALAADPESNVTITPHIGWQGPWTWVDDSQPLWRNVRAVLDGGPIAFLHRDDR